MNCIFFGNNIIFEFEFVYVFFVFFGFISIIYFLKEIVIDVKMCCL